MKFKIEKNLRIINELITYCSHFGGHNVSIDIKNSETETFISVISKVSNFTDENLSDLKQALNVPRQHEIEQYYWHLGGESEFDSEICLVGMMVDEVKVSFIDNVLNIEVKRFG